MKDQNFFYNKKEKIKSIESDLKMEVSDLKSLKCSLGKSTLLQKR